MDYSRRRFIGAVSAILTANSVKGLSADEPAIGTLRNESNFHYIYGNEAYRNDFYRFLANVFHLQPETDLHQLISQVTAQHDNDRDIYIDLHRQNGSIRPFLSELTYGLPALARQKHVIAAQTTQLLPERPYHEGYLEVGSTGRYLDALEENLAITGERYFLSPLPATYAVPDMIDRGQIARAGLFIDLNNYQSNLGGVIPDNSIDLATVYIGFHHCPIALREEFITSIRDALKPGASMILRDHNVHDETMWRMVALAHDVFNMGTNESWTYNESELRKFYSLDTLDSMLRQYGFLSDGVKLFQDGDPTLNALMLYRKA
jgi:SAM-dependent methyltransferase